MKTPRNTHLQAKERLHRAFLMASEGPPGALGGDSIAQSCLPWSPADTGSCALVTSGDAPAPAWNLQGPLSKPVGSLPGLL